MILLETNEDGAPILSENEIFDDNGNIKEQDGVNYFYGVYDFEPRKEVWKTNLELNEFKISHVTKSGGANFYKRTYTISLKIKKSTIFDKGNIIVAQLRKIDRHGYILKGGMSNLIQSYTARFGYTCTIEEHQIQYTFVG